MADKSYMVLLGDLTQKNLRRSASTKIAQILGVRDLTFFVQDPQVKLYIPAAGYGQILKSSLEWQSFLRECSEHGKSTRALPWPDHTVAEEERSFITGISLREAEVAGEQIEAVLVFLGEPVASEALDRLVGLLPLLASCIRYEWIALGARNTEDVQFTEMKKSEHLLQQLDKTRLELQNALYLSQKALSTRNDFLSVASHELKTPLQSILLEVGLMRKQLLKNPDPAGIVKSLARFESLDIHLRRMTTLVDNLLDYSQVAEGRLIFKHQFIDLSDLTADVIRRLRRQAFEAGCEIHLHAPEKVFITCDHSKMDQVISNLVTNAIKYGSNRDIFVGVSLSGDRPLVFVKDQGVGIPFAEQSKIFDRFERCQNTRDISGFGLGLFVVKQIIDGHGGEITVESEPHKGSTFTVILPQKLNQPETRYEQVH